jgi:hypothetical protein
MSDRRIPRKNRILSTATENRNLIRSARRASQNAQRISRALEIPYEIIKDGVIYSIKKEGAVKVGVVHKIKSNTSGLVKGSKICL